MPADSKVIHVAFYDVYDDGPEFSHAYPGHTKLLPEHYQQPRWTISGQCPSLVRATVCDPSGEHRYWEGYSGDTFQESEALSVKQIENIIKLAHL